MNKYIGENRLTYLWGKIKAFVSNAISGKVDKVSSTDNAVVRFDGTTGAVQNSGVTINDSNHLTAAKLITSGGTSSQFVKGDGSLDSTSYVSSTNAIKNEDYLISSYVTLTNSIKGRVFDRNSQDTFFAANSRFIVTHKRYNSTDDSFINNLSTDLFKGTFNSWGNTVLDGEYGILYIGNVAEDELSATTSNTNCVFVYPQGKIFLTFYTSMRCGEILEAKGWFRNDSAWRNLTVVVNNALVYEIQVPSVSYLKAIRIKYSGSNLGGEKKTSLSDVAYIRNRDDITERNLITKYPTAQQMYGNLTAPKFITSGGTSGQFVKGDGTLDSTSYAPLASPALTGTPTAPTAASGTNTTQIATTAFVKSAIADKADSATTLAGYGITDAKIENGVITLGSNSITPITSHQDISSKADKSEMSVVAGTGNDADKTTITLKSGTSATVLTAHQDISGKQNALTFDSTPTANSTNPVTSGGVKTVLDSMESTISNLQSLYEALTQSSLVVVPSADWPLASLSENTIYRVQGTTSYTDYMYDGTNTIPMAEYDNGIDDVPTDGSDNFVKSGGVKSSLNSIYDILNDTTLKEYINVNDSTLWESGTIVSSTGANTEDSARIRTNFIKVDGGTLSETGNSGSIYCYFYDLSKTYLGWGSSSIKISSSSHLAWSDAKASFPTVAYVRLGFKLTTSMNDIANFLSRTTFSENTLYVDGETQHGLVGRVSDLEDSVESINEDLQYGNSGFVKLSKNATNLTFGDCDTDNVISGALRINSTEYDNNRNFNFLSANINGITISNSDDIAPNHILNTTIGGNHGQPCVIATITSHGLTNASVGTLWSHSNGYNYYIMRIVDSDSVVLLGQNRQTETNPKYTKATVGTITKDATTLTITAVADTQLRPSCGNNTVKILKSDGREINSDGIYKSRYFDVVEKYDVFTPDSIIENLVSSVGNTNPPQYTGSAVFRVRNTYRFLPQNNVLVIVNNTILKSCAFSDLMFSQSLIFSSSSCKVYVPNSLPYNGIDFRKPISVTWGSGVESFYSYVASMQDPNVPVNRVLKYNGTTGFALGILTTYGVGKNLKDYTSCTFEIRGTSGKIYPHVVDSGEIGTTINANNTYEAVLYRTFFTCSPDSARMSMYHFNYNDAEYVYIDYSASIYDTVIIDDMFNGKRIEEIESSNTSLETEVYNGCLCVNAEYIDGETCYIVLKIHNVQ